MDEPDIKLNISQRTIDTILKTRMLTPSKHFYLPLEGARRMCNRALASQKQLIRAFNRLMVSKKENHRMLKAKPEDIIKFKLGQGGVIVTYHGHGYLY